MKGLGSAFTSMNLPDLSSRFVQVPVIGFLICERALTAPLRWLSPGSCSLPWGASKNWMNRLLHTGDNHDVIAEELLWSKG